MVEFSVDVYSVGEDAGFVEIVLTIFPAPNNTEFVHSVLFSTADGTATGKRVYWGVKQANLVHTYQPSSFLLDNQAKIQPIPPENYQIPLFKPRRACAARVTVVGSVCVSVTLNLTSRVFVRLTKDTTYLTGNEGQNIWNRFL